MNRYSAMLVIVILIFAGAWRARGMQVSRYEIIVSEPVEFTGSTCPDGMLFQGFRQDGQFMVSECVTLSLLQ